MSYTQIASVLIGPQHGRTSFARHFADGAEVPSPHELRIVRLSPDPGVLLLHLDQLGLELTDTWHQSVEDAMEQARLEFGIVPLEWQLREPGK